jgi:YHS domain-containing protein
MTIQCDQCGAEVEKDGAVLWEDREGEVLYFCSEECRDTAVLEDEEEDEAAPARGPAA